MTPLTGEVILTVGEVVSAVALVVPENFRRKRPIFPDSSTAETL